MGHCDDVRMDGRAAKYGLFALCGCREYAEL